jgi:hypothetical protein
MRAEDLWCVAWNVDDFFEVLMLGDLMALNRLDVEKGAVGSLRAVVDVTATLDAARIRKVAREKERYGAARAGRKPGAVVGSDASSPPLSGERG